jgi:hypothetical protein
MEESSLERDRSLEQPQQSNPNLRANYLTANNSYKDSHHIIA